jgi:hypothetical protein
VLKFFFFFHLLNGFFGSGVLVNKKHLLSSIGRGDFLRSYILCEVGWLGKKIDRPMSELENSNKVKSSHIVLMIMKLQKHFQP